MPCLGSRYVVAFIFGTTSAQTVSSEDIAVVVVKLVDDESGVILLMVDKSRKIEGLERDDEIEVVMQEETDQMKSPHRAQPAVKRQAINPKCIGGNPSHPAAR